MPKFLKSLGHRRRWLLATLVAAALLVPAGLAWAYVSTLAFDSPSCNYFAGDKVTVTGRGFPANSPVTLTLYPPNQPGGAPVNTPGLGTDAHGRFTDSFRLADDAQPGYYAFLARVHGPEHTVAHREAFSVNSRPVPPAPAGPDRASSLPAPPTAHGPARRSRRARARAACKRRYRRNVKRIGRKAARKKRAACLRRANRLRR